MKDINRKIISEEDLEKLRKNNSEKKIVFCSGCFDILHSGHAVFLNQCKEFGDILVVGVGRDSIVRKYKGFKRPINPEMNRLFLVAAMQDVDYILLNQNILEGGEIDFRKTFSLLRPDIFVINEDNSNLEINKKICNEFGVEIKVLNKSVSEKLKPTSTTEIIEKIKEMRNL